MKRHPLDTFLIQQPLWNTAYLLCRGTWATFTAVGLAVVNPWEA